MFIAIVKLDGASPSKYMPFETKEDAEKHVDEHGGIVFNDKDNVGVDRLSVVDGKVVVLDAPAPDKKEIDVERDKRIKAGLPFKVGGKNYLFDFDEPSKNNIINSATQANIAILTKVSKEGDYRWHGGEQDFTWITKDNSVVRLDAPTMAKLGVAAIDWTSRHIQAARALKDMDPIPQDYQEDKYWK